MLLMAGIVAEASQRGLTPLQILAAIPLLIPSTLPYTLPATTLFATCVVYGRLAPFPTPGERAEHRQARE